MGWILFFAAAVLATVILWYALDKIVDLFGMERLPKSGIPGGVSAIPPPESIESSADRAYEHAKKIWDGRERRYEIVDDPRSEIPDLDHDRYDATGKDFEALGYRFLADYEERNGSELNPEMRTYHRCLVSPDATTVICITHFKNRTPEGLTAKFQGYKTEFFFIELETQYDDGRSLRLSTQPPETDLHSPPWAERHLSKEGTETSALVDRFADLRAQVAANFPDSKPLVVESWEKAKRIAMEEYVRVCLYRKSVGYITVEDYERISLPKHRDIARKVGREMELRTVKDRTQTDTPE